MVFAQKLHSYMELEVGRIRFYLRFKKIREFLDKPYLTYTPAYEYPD